MQVCTPQEMKQLEEQAANRGVTPELLMEEAGKQAANAIISYVKNNNFPQKALIIAGKGNNGGDGYVIGRHLLAHGFAVQVWQALPIEPTSLIKKQRRRFEARSGKIIDLDQNKPPLPPDGVIVDAIFGTGFHGVPESAIQELIGRINQSKLPIISIDVPSGVNAENGKIEAIAIVATLTIAIECAKTGYFLRKACNHIGQIIAVPIGLTPQNSTWHILEEQEIAKLRPKIVRNHHKYQRGHVVGIAGSTAGATLLASYAALKSGAGIVHLLHNAAVSFAFAGLPLEVVKVPYQTDDYPTILSWINRAGALFFGPGLGTGPEQEALLASIWQAAIEKKVVIDADALTMLGIWLGKKKNVGPLSQAILTPHLGELERLLGISCKEGITLEVLGECQKFVDTQNTNLVLKGFPTFLFSANTPMQIVLRGDPGMATGGSGDVLTGILSSVLAQGLSPIEAMRFGVYLHSMAGEFAAKAETSYSVTASSITGHISSAYAFLIDKYI